MINTITKVEDETVVSWALVYDGELEENPSVLTSAGKAIIEYESGDELDASDVMLYAGDVEESVEIAKESITATVVGSQTIAQAMVFQK